MDEFQLNNVSDSSNPLKTKEIKLTEHFEDCQDNSRVIIQDICLKEEIVQRQLDCQNSLLNKMVDSNYFNSEQYKDNMISSIQNKVHEELEKEKERDQHEYSPNNMCTSHQKQQLQASLSQINIQDQLYITRIFNSTIIKHNKWYKSIFIMISFILFYYFGPFFSLFIFFGKKKQKQVQPNEIKKFILIRFHLFLLFSSVVLWMTSISYIYLRISKPVSEEEEYNFLLSHYHQAFLYHFLISVCFSMFGESSFANNSLILLLFKQNKHSYRDNLLKGMKELYISQHDFIFQFSQFQNEDIKKKEQGQKIKKVFRVDNNSSKFLEDENRIQYYCGLDLCDKIVQSSANKKVGDKFFMIVQIILTIIIYIKSMSSLIFRYFFEGNEFIKENVFLTLIPVICAGNIIGFFGRLLNGMNDLQSIQDYNRALNGLISYDHYLIIKPKFFINMPSINLTDIKTIKTWSQMRILLNEFKKKENIPIDRCTFLMFVYLMVIFLGAFLDQYYGNSLLLSFISQKYIIQYYSIDVILISILFTQRVNKQTQINSQFKQQFQLVQQAINIVVKLLLFRESFQDKSHVILLDKDIQWKFYSELEIHYQNNMNFQMNHNKIKSNSIDKKICNINQENPIHEQLLQSISKQQDYEYLMKLSNILKSVQEEISMEIKQTPMKFLGLFPSSYGLLLAFLYGIVSFIYIIFYLYIQRQQVIQK